MIYFDNGATTYPKPQVVYEALNNANINYAFNAGRGSYSQAKKTFQMINETRNLIGEIIQVSGDNVIFTDSATTALNMIINGLPLETGDTVYISPFEHNAIVRPLHLLKEKKGIKITVLPFDKKTWQPDYDRIKNLFALNPPKAIFLSHVSNVTGFILPYQSIFENGKKYNSINILDCAQSYGIIKPEIKNTDFIVFAGHKSLYASFGIAGFIDLTNYNLNISKAGGTGSDSLNPEMPSLLPGRYEAGSMNSVAIAGLHASLQWRKNNDIYAHEKELTDYLLESSKNLDKIITYTPETQDIFGILSFNIKGYTSDDIGSILSDEFDICVRTGYHCAPLVHEFIGSKEYLGTVRVSLGYFNTKEEIDRLVSALQSF